MKEQGPRSIQIVRGHGALWECYTNQKGTRLASGHIYGPSLRHALVPELSGPGDMDQARDRGGLKGCEGGKASATKTRLRMDPDKANCKVGFGSPRESQLTLPIGDKCRHDGSHGLPPTSERATNSNRMGRPPLWEILVVGGLCPRGPAACLRSCSWRWRTKVILVSFIDQSAELEERALRSACLGPRCRRFLKLWPVVKV